MELPKKRRILSPNYTKELRIKDSPDNTGEYELHMGLAQAKRLLPLQDRQELPPYPYSEYRSTDG
jgi:hypothetical protein